jgi:hypothetical protein
MCQALPLDLLINEESIDREQVRSGSAASQPMGFGHAVGYRLPSLELLESAGYRSDQNELPNCRCSRYRGIPVHLLLGPVIGPSSAQGKDNDPSYREDPHEEAPREENDDGNC